MACILSCQFRLAHPAKPTNYAHALMPHNLFELLAKLGALYPMFGDLNAPEGRLVVLDFTLFQSSPSIQLLTKSIKLTGSLVVLVPMVQQRI